MPAEWEPHEGTWISWPKDPQTFPGDILPKVEEAYGRMVRALCKGEEVKVLVDGAAGEARARSHLPVEGVAYRRIRTVDVWVRDYGPIYVKGRGLAATKWVFNAWGGKYEDLVPDDDSGEAIAASTGLEVFRTGKVLEGGSVDTDGEGTVLTTQQCLLNPNRNPGLGEKGVEDALSDFLGAKKVVWLGGGIEGDDTDGHVDDVARFVGPGKVVYAAEENPSDPNRGVLESNLRTLEGATDSRGRRLELVRLPMPGRTDSPDGRLPASHVNFYIGNSAVVVPTFGGESDSEALRTVQELFPKREAVGVDCRALVYGLGTLHCVTQQAPAP